MAKYNKRMSMSAFDLKAAPVHFLPYENSLYFYCFIPTAVLEENQFGNKFYVL